MPLPCHVLIFCAIQFNICPQQFRIFASPVNFVLVDLYRFLACPLRPQLLACVGTLPAATMGFINAANRKRARSSSRSLLRRHHVPKTPKLDFVLLGGAASCHAVGSTCNTGRPSGYLRARLKRTSSHIKTLLGFDNASSDEPPCLGVADPMARREASRISEHSLHPSTSTMIVRPSKGGLTTIAIPQQTRLALRDSPTPGMNFDDSCNRSPSRPPSTHYMRRRSSSMRRTTSTQSLHRRLSCKFQDVFGQTTVKRRSSSYSRPSVDSVVQTVSSPVVAQSSAASTATSGSYVVLNGGLSTPPTSDGVTVSPMSLKQRPPSESWGMARAAAIFNAEIERHRLSPICETVAPPSVSIATVEAAANAKIFLETHFNQMLAGITPLVIRRAIFEEKLESLNLSVEMQEKA